jgi:hypothetical protein
MKTLKNNCIQILITLALLAGSVSSPASAQTNTPTTDLSSVFPSSYYRPFTIDPAAYDSPYRLGLFRPEYGEDGARAWSQTKSVFIYGFGVIGVLLLLPEESTGWDKEDDAFGKWVENVKAGPEWDRNKWYYNYVGHTYVGGVYYQVARKSGYRQWDSFMYTVLMSTFYWEYGIEAFAEVPSIQDLVFTPLAGWLYGEWAYQTEKKVRDNENRVLGSGILGNVSLFFLDPIDSIGRGVNRVTGKNLVKSGYGYFSYNPVEVGGNVEHEYYLNMRMPIGVSGPPAEEGKIKAVDDPNDPVNYGIIGISGGAGYAMLDEYWGMEDGFYSKITLGLYFTPRASLRLGYAWGDFDKTDGTGERRYENYSLDTQIYLNKNSKLRPYVTGGFGDQLWDEDNDSATFQWNAGVGAHWQTFRKLAVNTEWLHYYSPSKKTYDQQMNLGIIYRFGEGEHSRW